MDRSSKDYAVREALKAIQHLMTYAMTERTAHEHLTQAAQGFETAKRQCDQALRAMNEARAAAIVAAQTRAAAAAKADAARRAAEAQAFLAAHHTNVAP